jgi:hypothetical protein
LFAAVLLFRGGQAIRESFEASHWPDVGAVVTESDARWQEHRLPVRKSMWTHELHLRYVYTIGSREYIGTRASFSAWGPNENLNPLSSAIAAKFPVGMHVLAHYDPAAPSRSVLLTTARPSTWVALFLGILLAWLGLRYSRRVELEKKQFVKTSP